MIAMSRRFLRSASPVAAAVAALVFAAVGGPSRPAVAADPPPPGDANTPPDESILGTVEVNGSANSNLPPLPKIGVVPIIPTGSADSLVTLVVRHDMELSGQFDVLNEDTAPAGPFTHTTPVDLVAWREKGAEYVLRVFAQPGQTDSTKTELVGEAYVTPTPQQ